MPKSKKTKRSNLFRLPVIGKYIDTPTKTKLEVVYFVGETGNVQLSIGNFPPITLKSCRFQLKMSDVKRHKKFYKKLLPYLEFSAGFKALDRPEPESMPFLFGLLKLRKNKKRAFVWIQASDQFFKSRVVNVLAAEIDNLLYLDLIETVKKEGLTGKLK